MSDKFVPVNEPLLNGNEKDYLIKCIDTGWISSEGPFVSEFEQKFSSAIGREYGIAVSSGSAALDIAVKAVGINPGDEVIVPTFTIISCVASIIRAGAMPVLVDCDPLTFNMNVEQVADKISEKTKAILAVHIYGLPVDMDPILDIAKQKGLKVIEDAAEMHGQDYKGILCGNFGDISVFSFYPNKHLTTGEGGMLLTGDEEIAERCKSYRNLCFNAEKRFVHDELGWNYRMTNLQAALGVAQLEQLDNFVVKKREIGQKYNQLLGSAKGIQIPVQETKYAKNIYWVYSIMLEEELGLSAEEVMIMLGKRGVGTRPFFWPMHMQPVFHKMGLFHGEKYPEAEKASARGFYLPSGMALTNEQIKYSAKELCEVLNG